MDQSKSVGSDNTAPLETKPWWRASFEWEKEKPSQEMFSAPTLEERTAASFNATVSGNLANTDSPAPLPQLVGLGNPFSRPSSPQNTTEGKEPKPEDDLQLSLGDEGFLGLAPLLSTPDASLESSRTPRVPALRTPKNAGEIADTAEEALQPHFIVEGDGVGDNEESDEDLYGVEELGIERVKFARPTDSSEVEGNEEDEGDEGLLEEPESEEFIVSFDRFDEPPFVSNQELIEEELEGVEGDEGDEGDLPAIEEGNEGDMPGLTDDEGDELEIALSPERGLCHKPLKVVGTDEEGNPILGESEDIVGGVALKVLGNAPDQNDPFEQAERAAAMNEKEFAVK